MARTQTHIRGLIIVMVAALAGLVAVQGALLSNAMELKEGAFQRNVMAALEGAAQDMAAGEAAGLLLSTMDYDSLFDSLLSSDTRMRAILDSNSLKGAEISVSIDVGDPPLRSPFRVVDDHLEYTVESPRHIMIAAVQTPECPDTVLVNRFHAPGLYQVHIDTSRLSGSVSGYRFASGSTTGVWHTSDTTEYHLIERQASAGKRGLVTQVFRSLMTAELRPIEARLDSLNIDSTLTASLLDAGIDLGYTYAVFGGINDSLRVASAAASVPELRGSDFRVRLFPQDVFAEPAYLSVFFPGRTVYLWGQMSPLLGASVLFMLIVVGGFTQTIRTISRQRRLASHMVEFVNNMTHEFKTPISTVTLAAEALDREDVRATPGKIAQFNEMIKSEVQRMRSQTEKILQMAALEERDISLSVAQLDLHELLRDAVEILSLKINERDGTVRCEFAATDAMLQADRVHLTNVIYNLLDNANKYSPEAPEITVRTFDSARGVGFRIEDRGLGLKPEDQKQVFEKYYRASTGNVHNVKGFGLGLSYVRLIVTAHGGEITLHSVFGEGSEIEVILPRIQSG